MVQTTKELLALFREVLYGLQPANRLRATVQLAAIYDEAGDQATADRLRAAPTLTPLPHVLTLARALSGDQLGTAMGQMASGRVSQEMAEAMAFAMNDDDLLDLAEGLQEAIEDRMARARVVREQLVQQGD